MIKVHVQITRNLNLRTKSFDNALLDTGSDTTLLHGDIAAKLQLKGENRKLNINSALSHHKKHYLQNCNIQYKAG